MGKAEIIDGRQLAAELTRKVRDEIASARKFHRLTPGLAVVLVGENEASKVYVRNKVQQCEAVGIKSFAHHLPADIRNDDLLTLIRGLNGDDRVNGILVQLPLPAQIDPAAVLATIDPDKDVDGFHVVTPAALRPERRERLSPALLTAACS